jgi:dihydroneopterin aldolase
VSARPAPGVLEVRAVRLRARLGWSAEERSRPQAIDLSLRVEFAGLPQACETDELGDTACYAQLVERARSVCAAREFRLVEHLAQILIRELRELVPKGAALELTVSKPHTPVVGLRGGVHFTLRG